MSKNAPPLSDFVRDAIREKAARELRALDQRVEAFTGVERTRDALHALASDLTAAATSVTAVAGETGAAAKLKKLRKLVDDAHALATEIGDALGVDAQREALAA